MLIGVTHPPRPPIPLDLHTHFLHTEVDCYGAITSSWKATILCRLHRETSFAFQTSFLKIRVSFDEIKLQFQLLAQIKQHSLHNLLLPFRTAWFPSQLPTNPYDVSKLSLIIMCLWLVSITWDIYWPGFESVVLFENINNLLLASLDLPFVLISISERLASSRIKLLRGDDNSPFLTLSTVPWFSCQKSYISANRTHIPPQ